MLVLSRRVGEKLVIGDKISVVVNKLAGNRVSLGITAPNDVRIRRGEIDEHARSVDDPSEPRGPTPKLPVADITIVSPSPSPRAR
jgi:carbon storage regulator